MHISSRDEGGVAFSKALMTALWLTVSADTCFLHILAPQGVDRLQTVRVESFGETELKLTGF